MNFELKLLKSNLQEVYCAAHDQQSPFLRLVSNFSGTRLYFSGSGWGRIWSWIFNLAEYFWKDVWLVKVRQALIKTCKIFEKNLYRIRPHLLHYEAYVKKSCEGFELREKDYFDSRKEITRWNLSTKPFVNVVMNGTCEKLSRLFTVYGLTNTFIYEEFEKSKLCQKIIDLEGFSRGPLPLHSLEKCALRKKITTNDLTDLSKWVKKLNSSSCGVRQFHKTFKLLYKETLQDNIEERLAKMELFLEELGCILFRKKDKKYLDWRNSLKEGSEVDHKYLLGKQIEKKNVDFDHFRVFKLTNLPGKVLVTGFNTAILQIRQLENESENSFGIKPLRFDEIDPQGKWAIMEELKPLHTLNWTSTHGLSQEDKKQMQPFVQLVQWLIQKNSTPEKFSSQYLMLDRKGELTSLKPTKKGEFDFNALEDFLFICSSGNDIVFKHLMEASGLYHHKIADFYREIVKLTLAEDTSSVENMGGIYGVLDPKVIDRATLLKNQVQEMVKQIKMQGSKSDFKESKAKFYQNYLQSKAVSSLRSSAFTSGLTKPVWPLGCGTSDPWKTGSDR